MSYEGMFWCPPKTIKADLIIQQTNPMERSLKYIIPVAAQLKQLRISLIVLIPNWTVCSNGRGSCQENSSPRMRPHCIAIHQSDENHEYCVRSGRVLDVFWTPSGRVADAFRTRSG